MQSWWHEIATAGSAVSTKTASTLMEPQRSLRHAKNNNILIFFCSVDVEFRETRGRSEYLCTRRMGQSRRVEIKITLSARERASEQGEGGGVCLMQSTRFPPVTNNRLGLRPRIGRYRWSGISREVVCPNRMQ